MKKTPRGEAQAFVLNACARFSCITSDVGRAPQQKILDAEPSQPRSRNLLRVVDIALDFECKIRDHWQKIQQASPHTAAILPRWTRVDREAFSADSDPMLMLARALVAWTATERKARKIHKRLQKKYLAIGEDPSRTDDEYGKALEDAMRAASLAARYSLRADCARRSLEYVGHIQDRAGLADAREALLAYNGNH